jgi:hypothetical protein
MNGSTPKRSPWGKTCSGTVTLGDYGTFFSPERRARGFWRLQTDYQPLIDMMKKRCWDKKSPWKMTGWGTSYIFRRSFHGTYEAERSFERILQKLEAKDCSHVNPFSESTPQKVPPLTGENSGSSSLYSEKKEEI